MNTSKASVVVVTFGLLAAACGVGCTAHVAASPVPAGTMPSITENTPKTVDWDGFWRSHSVSPPPPKDFLDSGDEPSEILNLTHGLLGDDVVLKWILADVRRGRGDAWAANHLRMDIVNADVLGPPGLNGTDRAVERERARGTVETTCPMATMAAAGVIAISKDTQRRMQWAGLTDFVIVLVHRSKGEPCKRTASDGTIETLPLRRRRGELMWQLDTGEFRDDPVVGPLWYQAHGWSCQMDGRGVLDEICGLVQPSRRNTTTVRN